MKIESIKYPLILITYAVLAYFVINNLSAVADFLNFTLSLLSPLFIGVGIAFVVNLLLRLYEEKILNRIFQSKKLKKISKIKRPVGMLLAYATAVAIIVVVVNFIIPQISVSIKALADSLPGYMAEATSFLQGLAQNYDFTKDLWTQFINNIDKIISNASQIINAALPQLLNITKGLTSGVINIFLGLVFSVYMLSSKEKLISILKKLIYVMFKKETADKITEVSFRANKVFRSFVGGQLIEGVILAILCFVGMSVFRMPYAPLVSVIVGITSLVPVLGTYVGVVISAFLILLESFVYAFWFVVFIIVLQQIEGNFIYPRVVGNAIGLSGMWVLLAVTVGGSLFGVLGILLGVPVMAVIYSLFSEYVNNTLKQKSIKIKQER